MINPWIKWAAIAGATGAAGMFVLFTRDPLAHGPHEVWVAYSLLVTGLASGLHAGARFSAARHASRILPTDRFAAINARYPHGYRRPQGNR